MGNQLSAAVTRALVNERTKQAVAAPPTIEATLRSFDRISFVFVLRSSSLPTTDLFSSRSKSLAFIKKSDGRRAMPLDFGVPALGATTFLMNNRGMLFLIELTSSLNDTKSRDGSIAFSLTSPSDSPPSEENGSLTTTGHAMFCVRFLKGTSCSAAITLVVEEWLQRMIDAIINPATNEPSMWLIDALGFLSWCFARHTSFEMTT
mmetsp:Transcript_18284/g.41943  ORF Transcript_18284/g.41943 Transcript_18284/m.41943 type:complete len:205 (-) Transcript_18284:1013-1627(-)